MRLLLAGLALAGALAFGVAAWAMHLYGSHQGLAGVIDSRVLDLGSLVLNVALLFAFFRLSGLRRGPDVPPEGTE